MVKRALCLGAALLALASCGAPTTRPNLLLVTVDTLRADRLACYGGPADVGSALCATAEGGTRFTWAFSTAPSTSPSIASLLTSLHVPQHRVTQNLDTALGDDFDTVAEILQAAGYHTAAFVSNPMLHHTRRLDQGFDHYDHRMTRREPNRPGFAERDAVATTRVALEWARANAHSPWFIWVHYQDPHGPYDPPGSGPARDPAGASTLAVLTNQSGRGGIPAYQVLPGASAPETYARRYLDEIRHLDAQFARLLAGLDSLGSRPAVLITSDHGEAFGEDDFWFAHGHSAGIDQIRVPLLFRPARPRPGGGVVAQPVSLVDVAPTLLGLAGIAPPAAFVGRPLPLEPATTQASAAPIFAEAGRHVAIIDGGDYYTRERLPGATTTAEGRPWGDENPALPARTTRLGDDGTLADYTVVETAPPSQLEAALSAHLRANPIERRVTGDAVVPDEVRDQLRALGYDTDD